ncbi:MAG: class I SAM-dependent methyltransferase [Prevotellaceae bacterium]|nr:class I SAM-dependent methyltransferase [Prevotellaceae bacterium]
MACRRQELARLFGFTPAFYRKGIGDIALAGGMRALDLGCGPGALSFALAEIAHPQAEITGIDISEDQLNYARSQCGRYRCTLRFENRSMDELPFPDAWFEWLLRWHCTKHLPKCGGQPSPKRRVC